jgi:hypothetical protein
VDHHTSLRKAHLDLGETWVAYLPAFLLLPVVLVPPLNHDVAANLDFTQRWISGEALYSRLLTTDPPLIFGLNLLPAYLGKYTALGTILAFQLCVLLYGAVVWWLTVRLRRHSEEGAVERHFLNVAPVLVLVGAGYDFGQREHLMVLGALPYLFLATRRVQEAQGSYRYVVAILAALAFAIKPYFLVHSLPRPTAWTCTSELKNNGNHGKIDLRVVIERWSHFLTQPAKVDSPMQRMIHHENAKTVFG